MNPLSDQKAFEMLRRAGLVEKEIARLCRLRRTYRRGELDYPPLDQRRLQFARWLVRTGRLTEQCPTTEKHCSVPLAERAVPARFLPPALPFLFF